MSRSKQAALSVDVERQIARVSRRLFWQTFLDVLVWCWAGALATAACWFLVQPWLFEAPAEWLRWAVAGGLVMVATLLGCVLAFMQAPSKLDAALSLDEKFDLRERVTTSVTLEPEQAASPAGLALLADVQQRISKLDVGARFPVSMSRSAFMVPVCAALFCAVAFLYEPSRGQARPDNPDDPKAPPSNQAAIEEKMKELAKKKEKRLADRPKSEEIEKLEAKLDEIANKPRDNKEQLRERVKEMTALEDVMKKREQELADKNQSLKQQLKQLDKLAQKQGSQEGPAKDLQKALAEGNMDKTREEMERLAKKMNDNELSSKEQQQLAKQLKEIEEKLERLAEQKDKMDELKKLAQEGKINAETLKRELENLKKDAEKLKQLQELAKKLGECQNCMGKGDGKGAGKKMQEASEQLKKIDLDDNDLKDLRDQLQRLQDAKECCGQGLGRGETQGNGMGAGDRPGGKRPVAEESPYKSYESRNRVEFDPSGKKIFDGHAHGQNFRTKTTAELAGEIKQASQEAPEAIEQQRIPKAYRDSAKDYFRNLGGQGEKAPKKD